MTTELWRLSATDVVGLLRRGEVSPVELVEASAARIEATDSHLNAMPTLCIERALDDARRIMNEGSGKERPRGWLGGLPIAVKDLVAVKDVRTTWGSPIYADHIPPRSDIFVENLEAHGAIVIGKSNTPEFGAGASTFNEVFGKTHNPWNVEKSCAGSSGGSASALAAGQVWLATGSDLGGSLRIPASFCSVFGFRPSPGRVARGPQRLPFESLMVEGPMARDARDAALFLDAMTGAHPEDPLSLEKPTESFADAVARMPRPNKIAYSPDLGLLPVDREVAALCAAAAEKLGGLGIEIAEDSPDLSGSIDTFQVLRAALFAADKAELLETQRDKLKPDIIWNIDKGLALDADTIGRAERERGRYYQRVARFFERHELLLCPTVIVPPFDVDIRWIEEIEGHRFDNYVDWLGLTFVLTLTACPSASVPIGFTKAGLPVGLQILGPPRAEAQVLAAGALIEEAVGLTKKAPVDPRGPDGQSLI
jgi:amidase